MTGRDFPAQETSILRCLDCDICYRSSPLSTSLSVQSGCFPHPIMLISETVKECLHSFENLHTIVREHNEHQFVTRTISNEYARFKIWSSNIGAHRTGRSSLDYRLRDSSHLQDHVFRLLKSLLENLNDGKHITSI